MKPSLRESSSTGNVLRSAAFGESQDVEMSTISMSRDDPWLNDTV